MSWDKIMEPIAAAIAAVGGCYAIVRYMRASFREGVRDLIKTEVPPIVKREVKDEVKEQLAPIKAELSMNHGESVKDAVNEVRRDVRKLKGYILPD